MGVPDQLKVGVTDPMGDVGFGAGKEVVDADYVVAEEHEAVDEVGADKAGALRGVSWVVVGARGLTPVTRMRFLWRGLRRATGGNSQRAEAGKVRVWVLVGERVSR